MSEKKKLFVVSDVHGHATLLKNALREAGFDASDPKHLFVSCGDLFDRGPESAEVMHFVQSLPHKVLVRGNHEDILESILYNGRMTVYDVRNGTDITLVDLFGKKAVDPYGMVDLKHCRAKALEVQTFLDGMLDYFETESYVFTHGWLPVWNEMRDIDPAGSDWRRGSCEEWHRARYYEWMDALAAGATLPDKTVVCGHRGTQFASRMDPSRRHDQSDPYYAKGMIAIDALTVVSGRLNVLVLEDTVPEKKTHRMKLMPEMLEAIKADQKQFEVRMLDEKREAICVGDGIVFENRDDSTDTLMTRVMGLHRYRCFDDLLEGIDASCLGFENAEAALSCLHSVYGERENKARVLAIRIMRETAWEKEGL